MASIYTTFVNQQHALIVHSPFVAISQCLNQVEEIIHQKSKAGQPIVNVCFIAKEELQIDENLRQYYWHGKNLIIISKTVKVMKTCEWNVSGVHGPHASSQPAENGKEWGDPGQNGEDGTDGENGGSVYFLVEDFHNLSLLRIKANGGNGGRGQPGGNGCNGKPGTDGFELTLKDLKEKFPSDKDYTFWKVRSELEIVEKQSPWVTFVPLGTKFIQGTTKQRLHMTFAQHFGIFRTHTYFLVKGSQGTLGGCGGLPGRGGVPGRCGLAGKVTEIKLGGIEKLRVQELQSIVEAKDGVNGLRGDLGSAGIRVRGKVGRDVGYVAWAGFPYKTVYYGPGYLKLDTCEDPNDPISPGVWCSETSEYVRIVEVPAIPDCNDYCNVYRDDKPPFLQSVPPILPRKEHYKLSTEEIIKAYLPLLSKESAASEKTQILKFNPSINVKPLYPKLPEKNLNDKGGMNNPGRPPLANFDCINPKALPVPKDISKIKPILKLKSDKYETPIDVLAVNVVAVVDELVKHIRCSFLADLKLFIITHGFRSNAKKTWVTSMQNEILKHHPTYIVILLDWSSGSGGFRYAKAAANCLEVGKQLGKLIVYIQEEFSKQKIATYVWGIGHSLGSHLMGAAGRYCRSQSRLIHRITGLDPAGVGFENFTEKMLCSEDASFVDVIHTDGYHDKEKPPQKISNATLAQFEDNAVVNLGPYGTMKPCGHADFYPNSGYCQPGHDTWRNYILDMGTHSHSRAHALFTATIANKGLFATNLRFEEAPEMKKSPPNVLKTSVKVEMGFHCEPSTRGWFYLETTEDNGFINDQIRENNSHVDGITRGDIRDVLRNMIKAQYVQHIGNARYALIINIVKYTNCDHAERNGAQNDSKDLKDLLESLEYKYEVTVTMPESTKKDVFQTLDKFLRAIKNEKRSIDGIFLAVMGHGSNDNIIASDGKEIDIFTEIIERFGNGNCHNLMGVPQIFVIQTCRGDRLDISPMRRQMFKSGTLAEEDKSIPTNTEKELWSNLPFAESQTLPEMSDSLIIFSSYRDTKSFRYEDGAWFIQLFIKAVKIAAANKRIEILSLLNGIVEHSKSKHHMVEDCRDGVSHTGENIIFLKQLPVIENVGFTKEFFFQLKKARN